MKSGKRYAEVTKSVGRTAFYDITDTIALVKKNVSTKFGETVKVHIRTGYGGRHADQQIRSAAVLPHGTSKTVRILVFTKRPRADETQTVGTDYVDAEELIPRIQNDGWLNFDAVVATPNMMGVIDCSGRVLGPKGLIPNPKASTVTMDVTKAINDIKTGKIEYRLGKISTIHVPVGKAFFTEKQLAGSSQTLIDVTVRAKLGTAKGTYLKSVALAPTMGLGVKLNAAKPVN